MVFNLTVLKSRKGFTLVEMLVSTAIIGVLLTAMALIFSPVSSLANSIRRNSKADLIAVELGNYIEGRLLKANVVYIFNAKLEDELSEFWSESDDENLLNGIIILNRTNGKIYDARDSYNRLTEELTQIEPIGTVGDFVSSSGAVGDLPSPNAVYYDYFYNDLTFPMRLEAIFGNESFMRVSYTPMAQGPDLVPEPLSLERTKSFFLLNKNIRTNAPDDDNYAKAYEEHPDYPNYHENASEHEYIVIFYKRFDFGD
ncbi:MAG: prepilin-type N-terminal cleavage/methylation domain-containing protein [Oscillospiraceae bacterium]|nr:prepilin-type N-terminal cleavage/methylation domain-containing protein [Oscillospiraceae bacterium]